MAHSKKELQDSIAQMEAVYHDADTPQNIKDSIKGSLENAKKILAGLEKPAPAKAPAAEKIKTIAAKNAVIASKAIVKKAKAAAKQTPGSKAHKKSLKEIVRESKKLAQMYAGKSEKELQQDAKHKAKKAGSRTSASGKKYREYRANRVDVGSKTPYLEKGGKTPSSFLEEIEMKADDKSMTDAEFGDWMEKIYPRLYSEYKGITQNYTDKKLRDYFRKNKVFAAGGAMEAIGNPPYSKGGRINEWDDDQRWHVAGLNRPPQNFTPAAVRAFNEAFDLLAKEKPGEDGGTFNNYYDSAAAAMASLVNVVQKLFDLQSTDSAEAHQLLQEVGVYNYKTGLLLNTQFLNKELAARKLASGGDVNEKVWIVNIAMPAEKGTTLRKEEITLGRMSDEFDVQQAIKRKGLDWLGNGKVLSIVEKHAQGGRLKSALMRDRAYKSDEPWEQAYRRTSKPRNPRYKLEEGGELGNTLYLRLYHGRKKPDEQMNDWGSNGPIIGPVGISSTYGTIKLHGRDDFEELNQVENMILFNGVYYGDFEILPSSVAKEIAAETKQKIIGWDKFSKLNKSKASGGRLKSALMRDRAYKSDEPWEQTYDRQTKPRNPKYKLAKGGYAGKTAEQVWNDWTPEQRKHFLNDHNNQLAKNQRFPNIERMADKDYLSLGEVPRSWLDQHIKEGQYAKGGNTATYKTIKKWHQNTSKAGKEEVLAENVSLKEAEDALLEELNKRDNVSVDFKNGIVNDYDYSPSEIWVRGDGSLRYGDYTIVIEEEYAKGGRTARGISRDRKFQSKEPWEQVYERKSKPFHPKYRKKEGGPVTDVTKTEIIKSRVGKKTGYAFEVYFGDRKYPGIISALYKTEGEANTKLKDYLETGKIEFYGSAEMKKGGRTARGISRDRKFKSQEPHEQRYQRKVSPKNPRYKKHGEGGDVSFNDKVKAITKSLVGTPVPAKYQGKVKGKRYTERTAMAAAKNIAGSMRKKELAAQ